LKIKETLEQAFSDMAANRLVRRLRTNLFHDNRFQPQKQGKNGGYFVDRQPEENKKEKSFPHRKGVLWTNRWIYRTLLRKEAGAILFVQEGVDPTGTHRLSGYFNFSSLFAISAGFFGFAS
jgi:hypothetical protein